MAFKFFLKILRPLFNTNTPGICIEKWSQNFDLGKPSAIFGTPRVLKIRTLLEAVLHLFSQVLVSQDDGDEEDVKEESEEKTDQDHKVHIGVVLLHIIHPG